MKNLYKITPKNRWRIILGLSVVLLLIFLTSLFENKQLKEINESFGSLYKDRLIPASEIYQINTYFTQKSFVLEELKNVNDSLSFNFSPLLIKNNKKIDSLLKAYEETYFVKEEKLAFVKFKENYEDYQKKEVVVTQGMKNCELSISEKKDIGEALVFLNKININLAELVAIQSSVGKELLDDSKFNFGSSTLLFYFRFGLTLLVTAGILLLVKTSETNQRKKDPHINTMKVIKNKKNL